MNTMVQIFAVILSALAAIIFFQRKKIKKQDKEIEEIKTETETIKNSVIINEKYKEKENKRVRELIKELRKNEEIKTVGDLIDRINDNINKLSDSKKD